MSMLPLGIFVLGTEDFISSPIMYRFIYSLCTYCSVLMTFFSICVTIVVLNVHFRTPQTKN